MFADDAKLTKEDKKSQRLWGATEWHKQDKWSIWMEQDMGNIHECHREGQ